MFIQEIQNMFTALVNGISGGDPVIKGFVMLWFLASSSWLARNIPAKIWLFIKLHSLVSVTINKDSDIRNIEFFNNLQNLLINKNKLSLRSTSIAADEFNSITGFGYGEHLIFCDGRFYKLHKTKIENKGDRNILETITLTTYGRDIKVFDALITNCGSNTDLNYIFTNTDSWGSNSSWSRCGIVKAVPNIVIDPEVKKKIDETVLFFKNNKEWYERNGFPYKLTLLLYGNPGTGKTSIIRYITELLKADLYDTNIMLFNSNNIRRIKNISRKNIPAVLSIEDFESCALSRNTKWEKRKAIQKDDTENSVITEKEMDLINMSVSQVSLSEILNTLQGVNPLDNVVVILTTNYIDMVDDALYRNGRVDVLLEVGALNFPEVKKYYELRYNEPFPFYISSCNPIKACDMEALFTNNKFDSSGFIKDLLKLNPQFQEETFNTDNVRRLHPENIPSLSLEGVSVSHKGISE